MKKIALTSVLAVFAVSGAYAANAIDGNPLYMPGRGHAYSVTSLESHSENTNWFGLREEVGFGVSNKLAVAVNTSASEDESFDYMAWDDMSVKATFRALEKGNWKADLIGAYTLGPVWDDHRPFLDEDDTGYMWTLGARAGYVASNWTVAGHVAFNYAGEESFDWNEEGAHIWNLGLDAQYLIDSNWNLVAGVEYEGMTDDWAHDAGEWNGYFGVNYNFDSTKFIGAYVNGSMAHDTGDWEWEDGFGYGIKFGIQF